MRDEVFRQLHQPVQVHVGHLGLDHPELRQVPPRLRLLRAKRRPEAVHLAQRQRRRLNVKLAALRQVRGIAEVVHRKQRRRALARRRRQNRRIGPDISIGVKVFSRRAHDLRANPQNRRLPWATHPQMPPLLQKVDAMILQRDRVRVGLRHALHHLHVFHVQLVPARRALVRTHLSRDNYARFLREAFQLFKHFRRHALHMRHSLDRPGSIAKDGEQQLAALARVVEPPAQSDRFAFVPANLGNGGHRRSRFRGFWSSRSSFFRHFRQSFWATPHSAAPDSPE